MTLIPATGHPFSTPTVDGADVTVDYMLDTPNIITNIVMDLTLRKFIAEYLFRSTGEVAGGAILYTEVEENQTYADRDVQEIAPGQEFPIITHERQEVLVEKVRKWGGRFFVTDEARKRNRMDQMDQKIQQTANTIVRKQNAIAVGKMGTAVKTAQTFVGNNWSSGSAAYHPDFLPIADFGKIEAIAEKTELGVVFDTLLLNPDQMADLKVHLNVGKGGLFRETLRDFGFDDAISSPRVTAGIGYAVQRGQLGVVGLEEPLTTTTYRDEARQVTWVNVYVIPAYAVTNPFAIVKINSLAG